MIIFSHPRHVTILIYAKYWHGGGSGSGSGSGSGNDTWGLTTPNKPKLPRAYLPFQGSELEQHPLLLFSFHPQPSSRRVLFGQIKD